MLRAVRTASGATAVQIVYSSRRGSREIEHLGSAHDEAEREALKAAARQRIVEGQGVLDLGLPRQGRVRCRSPLRGWVISGARFACARLCRGGRRRSGLSGSGGRSQRTTGRAAGLVRRPNHHKVGVRTSQAACHRRPTAHPRRTDDHVPRRDRHEPPECRRHRQGGLDEADQRLAA